jgi:hypothetical protein
MKKTMDRRQFLKKLSIISLPALFSFGSLGMSLESCGGSSSGVGSTNGDVTSDRILFGLGNDPIKIMYTDPAGQQVYNALKPDILCAWLNGGRNTSTNAIYSTIDYFLQWEQNDYLQTWSDKGIDLMIITWENYDGQNPALGGPTYGDYHISSLFLQDIQTLCNMLKGYKGNVYFALATEQSTYTSCRYNNNTCSSNYENVVNQTTEEYFSKLRANILIAFDIIAVSLPNAYYGISFGGWLATYQQGRNFIKYFDNVINKSNFIFFQSMLDKTIQENNGFGNPQEIIVNLNFFKQYNKNVGVSHYMPHNQRADVVTSDMNYMASTSYIQTIKALNLKVFCFMYYGLLKNNPYGDLVATQNFRAKLK